MVGMGTRRRLAKRRASTRLSPRARALLGAGLGLCVVAVAVEWMVVKRKNRQTARDLYAAATEMTACYDRARAGASSLANALDLGPTDSAPFAECRQPTRRARDLARVFLASHFIGDRGSLAILSEQIEDYASLPQSPPVERLETLDVWQSTVVTLACTVANAEKALDPPCSGELASPTEAPEPRVLFGAQKATAESLSIEVASAKSLLLSLTRASVAPQTWLLASTDSGATWSTASFAALGRGGFDDQAPKLVAGSENPVAVGTPLVPHDPPLPSGTLVAATELPPARVFVMDGAELSQYRIPKAGEAWPNPARPHLDPPPPTLLPSGDLSSGSAEKETYFPFIARDPSTGHARLFASTSDHLFVFALDPPKNAELSLVSGSCPPSVLCASPQGLSLLVPVGRTVGAFPVKVPLAFKAKNAWKTATAACTQQGYAIAFLSSGRALVESTRGGSWVFDSPRVLAEPNEAGTLTHLRLVGSGEKLLAVYVRQGEEGLRVELKSSEDGSGIFR